VTARVRHATPADAGFHPDGQAAWDEDHEISGLAAVAESGSYNDLTDKPTVLSMSDVIDALYPVGSLYVSTLSTNPGTLLGRGTWAAHGAGRVLVGHDSGDADFDAEGKTGGAKTKAISAHSGADVADHAAHTHSVTSNVAVGDHASHTHTYTQVPNHVHVENAQGGTTASTTGTHLMTSAATGGSLRAAGQSTANPTGGVATGTTNGPSATLSHSVTNNAVTSGNPSATLAHSVTQPSDHSELNVVPPYIVVFMWKRTA
jgi:hypothetical protein